MTDAIEDPLLDSEQLGQIRLRPRGKGVPKSPIARFDAYLSTSFLSGTRDGNLKLTFTIPPTANLDAQRVQLARGQVFLVEVFLPEFDEDEELAELEAFLERAEKEEAGE